MIRMNSQLADRTLQQLMKEALSAAELKLIIMIFQRQKNHARLSELCDVFLPSAKTEYLVTAQLIQGLREAENWEKLLALTTFLLTPDDSQPA